MTTNNPIATAPALVPFDATASHVWGCERHGRAGSLVCCCAAVKAAADTARTVSRHCEAQGNARGADQAWALFDAASAAGCFLVPLGGTFEGAQAAAWLDWLRVLAAASRI